jgi:hypothetical protein
MIKIELSQTAHMDGIEEETKVKEEDDKASGSESSEEELE